MLARVSPELTGIEGVVALVNEVALAMPPVLLEVLALRAAGTGLGAELGRVEEVGAVVEEPGYLNMCGPGLSKWVRWFDGMVRWWG